MKRYSRKLGVGMISLMALGLGDSVSAWAQGGRETSGTRSQQAFELAMAQYQATSEPTGLLSGSAVASASVAQSVAAPVTLTAAAVAASTPPPVMREGRLVGPDGLIEGAAYIEAENIRTTQDDTGQDNIVIAYGNVEMRYKGKTIRADQVSYNAKTGVTVATGHTQTINEDGSVQFADSISYDDNMSSGISENFASMSPDNTKMFARRVERVNDYTNRMTEIIYTPCQLCVSHGVTQPPSWSIEASKVTQRKDKKMVYYDNAVVRLHGVPILYMPYMWTPDPEMPRASGFLQPKIGFTRKRGFAYEQPYLWSISPYSQLIIDPQFSGKINPLLNLDYEKHFYSGILHARFGFTNDSFFDNAGKRIGEADTRDYLLADGKFKINQDWRWSFTAQHVKDKSSTIDPLTGKPYGDNANFFERYNIDDPFKQVGELTVDSRELINQVNVTRQVSNAYFSLSMANFQSLQIAGYQTLSLIPGTTIPATTRPYVIDNSIYPTVAPLLEAYWSPKARVLGGIVTLSANGIVLQHKSFPGFAVAPGAADGSAGFDTARLSVGASWYSDFVTKGGLKGGPFIDLRHDAYHESDLTAGGLTADASRDLATAGFNLSYPLFKSYSDFNVIVEPVAQLAVSPKAQANPDIPREDSNSLEFDDTTLFAVNKSPGFDIYESGARLNLGVRSTWQFKSGLKVNTLVGRTLRDRVETQFLQSVAGTTLPTTYDPTGVAGKASDWIVDGDFDTSKGFYGYTKVRLDGNTLRLKQGETGFSVASPNTEATVRYIVNNTTPIVVAGKLTSVYGPNYKDVQVYARHFITKNWGVSARLDRDLLTDKWRRSTVSVIYRDDCTWFELIYQRNDTVLSTVNNKPQSSFMLRFNLSTLGTSGQMFTDVR